MRLLAAASLICVLPATCHLTATTLQAQIQQIRTTGGNPRIIHDLSNKPQRFDEVKWVVADPRSDRGSTVQLSCGGFIHIDDPAVRADAELTLRVLRSDRRANWQAVVASDRTRIQSRDDQALVVASSSDRGTASLGLTVTFVGIGRTVMAGDYSATVTGTITEN